MNAIALGLERVQRRPRGGAGDRRRPDRDAGARGLLLRQRGELPGRDREPAADARRPPAARRAGRAGASTRCARASRYIFGNRWPRAIMITHRDLRGVRLLVHDHDAGVRAGRAAPRCPGIWRARLGDRRRRGRGGLLHGGTRRTHPAGPAGARLVGCSSGSCSPAPRWRRGSGSAIMLFTVAGCLMALNGIAANTMLQLQAPDRLRGRVMGFYSFVVLGLAPFGSLQAGWLAEHFGVRVAVAVGRDRLPGRGRGAWPWAHVAIRGRRRGGAGGPRPTAEPSVEVRARRPVASAATRRRTRHPTR